MMRANREREVGSAEPLPERMCNEQPCRQQVHVQTHTHSCTHTHVCWFPRHAITCIITSEIFFFSLKNQTLIINEKLSGNHPSDSIEWNQFVFKSFFWKQPLPHCVPWCIFSFCLASGFRGPTLFFRFKDSDSGLKKKKKKKAADLPEYRAWTLWDTVTEHTFDTAWLKKKKQLKR